VFNFGDILIKNKYMRILKNNSRKNRLIKKLREDNLTGSESHREIYLLNRRINELDNLKLDIDEYKSLKRDNPRLEHDIKHLTELLAAARAQVDPLIKIKHRYFELVQELNIIHKP
jgi:DNA repair ATPase RecN